MGLEPEEWDLVVVGGGPGGYVAAIRAAQLGLRVAVVEQDELGGTCLNRGCIPTKAWASAAELAAHIRQGAEMGIRAGTKGVTVDWAALRRHQDATVSRLVKGIHFLFKKHGVTLVKGRGHLADPHTVAVADGQSGETRNLRTTYILLATGSRPAVPRFLPYDGRYVVTSEEALRWETPPARLVIVGGGVIGCEFASIMADLGSQVTVVEMMPRLLPMLDEAVGREMERLFRRRGIQALTGARVTDVRVAGPGPAGTPMGQAPAEAAAAAGAPGTAGAAGVAGAAAAVPAAAVTVTVEWAGKTTPIQADCVLVSVGRQAATAELGLTAAGVAVNSRGEIQVNERMQTSVPHIYAVGDATDCPLKLAHVASRQGIVAAHQIAHQIALQRPLKAAAATEPAPMSYRAVPSAVFTRPEAASVGQSEAEAKAAGKAVKSSRFPFLANGKALGMRESEGWVNLVAEADTGRLIGAQIVGPHASDLLAEITLAIEKGLTAEELAGTIHAHPTLAEAIMEAAEGVSGLAIHG